MKEFAKKAIQKIKAAGYVFYKSLTSPAYYKDLLSVKFGFSIKYIFILAFIAAAVTVPVTTGGLINDLRNELDKFMISTSAYYPDELVITMKDGQLSINQDEPFKFAIPEEYKKESLANDSEMEDIENIVVIDPEGTIDQLDEYKTVVLINKSNAIVRESNKIEVYPLSDAPDGELTKNTVMGILDKLAPFVDAIPYIILVLAFILALVYYFGFRLAYLLAVGGVLILASSARGLNLEFKKLYQIGLHAMTLPLVIEVMSTLVKFPINIPLWFLGLNLLMGILGLVYMERNK